MQPRLDARLLDEGLPDEPDVGALVLCRDASLVAEPRFDTTPVGLELGGQLVRANGGRSSREGDVPAAPRRFGEQRGRAVRGVVRVGRDDELDAHASSSEAPRRPSNSKSRTRKRPTVA